MIKNKYADDMEKEQNLLKANNPFNTKKKRNGSRPLNRKKFIPKKKSYYEPKKVANNYFNLILGSDYADLELEIRGLRQVTWKNKKGEKVIEYERKEGHYLTEAGAEDLLMELAGHLSIDIKLGYLTEKEFLKTQNIITKTLVKYVRNNLQRLGMDTEDKQRKARPLLVMMLNRIRATYSQSIQGKTNRNSHGEIKLSGGLDSDERDKYMLEDQKN